MPDQFVLAANGGKPALQDSEKATTEKGIDQLTRFVHDVETNRFLGQVRYKRAVSDRPELAPDVLPRLLGAANYLFDEAKVAKSQVPQLSSLVDDAYREAGALVDHIEAKIRGSKKEQGSEKATTEAQKSADVASLLIAAKQLESRARALESDFKNFAEALKRSANSASRNSIGNQRYRDQMLRASQKANYLLEAIGFGGNNIADLAGWLDGASGDYAKGKEASEKSGG